MSNITCENPMVMGSTDDPKPSVTATCDYVWRDDRGYHRCGNKICDGNGAYIIFDEVYICDNHLDDYLIEHEYIRFVT